MISKVRSYDTLLAGAVMAHFIQIENSAELYSNSANIRDASKLCPMRLFVGAMFSRLRDDFAKIEGSEKWHSEVARGLAYLDMEFSDVALKKRRISEEKCTKISVPAFVLLNRFDICLAWLRWHFQQQPTEKKPINWDEDEAEKHCETKQTDF
ncbi:hypothetical protein niasHT_021342 [Heterodera trifolii]|uniref:Uncharacterized protein n=1 Tax=Heterodera trifolii TaxID=157864 RepID=A0ABD2K700_9BILA